MGEVKIHNGKFTLGDSGLKILSGNLADSDEYISIVHDEVDALTIIGKGNRITNHEDPMYLSDGTNLDGTYMYSFPANSVGYGFVLVGDAEEYARFMWDRDNTVTLLNNSTNVANSASDTDFCICEVSPIRGDDDGTFPAAVSLLNLMGSTKRVIFDVHYSEALVAPTFLIFSELSGVDNLDPNLEINGTTVTPSFRYKGGDADGTDWDYWTYGADLTYQTVATAPDLNDGSPGLGPNDDAVKFNSSDYYKSSSTSVGSIGTEDFVFEVVFKTKTAAENHSMVHNKDGGSAGWQLLDRDDHKFRLTVEDDSSNVMNAETLALDVETLYHVMIFADRDWDDSYSCSLYVNGVYSDRNNIFSVGDMTSAVSLAIGATNTGAGACGNTVAYVAMWQSASWMDENTGWDDVAAERFAKFCGYYPQIANDTYMPTVATRDSVAYIDKYETVAGRDRKLYQVGDGWLRMCRRQDSNYDVMWGYLPETAVTNIIPNSEAFESWTKIDSGDTIANNAVECPDGRTAAASFIADSDTGSHGVRHQPTLTATTYSFSVFAKPGDRDWIWMIDNTVVGASCYFDVALGVIGTEGVGCDGYIEGPFNGGFYRCCIVFTGTADTHDLRIYTADSDGDVTVQGNGSSVNMYLWGAQCETSDYMTSPIYTSGGSAARDSDELRYVGDENVLLPQDYGVGDVESGFLEVDILVPAVNAGSYRHISSINDGGVDTDNIGMPVTSSNDLQPYIRASGESNGDCGTGGTDILDNTIHHLRAQWETDSFKASVDSTFGAEDTDVGMPDALDRIEIGANFDVGDQFRGLIRNFYLWGIEVEGEPPLE